MKLFAAFAAIASARTGTVVTEFCGFNLDVFYGSENVDLTYVKTTKKTWENRDPEKIKNKPRGPAHSREVVRVECGGQGRARPQNSKPLGGYPLKKGAPLIKCTNKGPNGTPKLKPNNRRYNRSKVLIWHGLNCV